MDNLYVVSAIFLMGLATFITRALPFVALHKLHDHPLLLKMGRILPPAVMVILVVYCLKDVSVLERPYAAPEFAAVTLVAVLHLWRRNALLSIFLGTGVYLLLLRVLVG